MAKKKKTLGIIKIDGMWSWKEIITVETCEIEDNKT
jgi:hypothetical protein